MYQFVQAFEALGGSGGLRKNSQVYGQKTHLLMPLIKSLTLFGSYKSPLAKKLQHELLTGIKQSYGPSLSLLHDEWLTHKTFLAQYRGLSVVALLQDTVTKHRGRNDRKV